jgi:Bromodomain
MALKLERKCISGHKLTLSEITYSIDVHVLFHVVWEKFQNGIYNSITEFVGDMRLMLENCYRFNGPDHSISRKAQRLETLLEQKLALLSRFSASLQKFLEK